MRTGCVVFLTIFLYPLYWIYLRLFGKENPDGSREIDSKRGYCGCIMIVLWIVLFGSLTYLGYQIFVLG